MFEVKTFSLVLSVIISKRTSIRNKSTRTHSYSGCQWGKWIVVVAL